MFLFVMLVANVDVSRPMDDPFQEAEYAAGPALDPAGGHTVMIHGGMDVLPPLLAAKACDASHRLLCVRVVDAVLQVGVFALFAVGLVVFAGSGRAAWLASLPAVLALALMDGASVSPVQTQQSVPGVRDLVALLALWPMLQAARAIDRGGPLGRWPFAALGVLAGAAPFWAYNRGLVLVVVAGLFVLGVCWLRWTVRPACWAVAGGAVALLAAPLVGAEFGSTAGNIAYWAANGAIWSKPMNPTQLLPALAFHGIGIGLAGIAGLAAWHDGRRGWVLLLGALALTAGLYFVQSWGRIDSVHMRWTLWPSLLLIAVGLAHLLGPVTGLRRPMRQARAITGGVLVLCVAGSLRFMDEARGPWGGLGANLRLLAGGVPPDDATIAGPDLVRVAGLVRESGRCTFAANNAAMVHLLSGAPPCSRFAFGAYIAPSMQAGVIEELRAHDPAIILWDAPVWWARIDKVPFPERMPVLGAWIIEHYPVVTTIGEHVIRTRAAVAN